MICWGIYKKDQKDSLEVGDEEGKEENIQGDGVQQMDQFVGNSS